MLLKTLGVMVILVVATLGAGLSSLSFRAWPTGFADYKLSVTPDMLDRLRALQSAHKFGPDKTTFYPGAINEAERAAAAEAVDATIRVLIAELPAHPQRSTVLRAMKITLANFPTRESEERDQILVYFTRIMEICGVDRSAELFNVWRYGFPLGWIL